MRGKEVVFEAMKLRGKNARMLADDMDYATASGVTERLRAKQDIRVDTLIAFLDALECDVIVKSRLLDKKTWVLDGKPEHEAGGEEK